MFMTSSGTEYVLTYVLWSLSLLLLLFRPQLVKSQISGNYATHGGGVYIEQLAVPTFSDTNIETNSASGNGGGLYVTTVSTCHPTCTAALFPSLVSHNRADKFGGGVYFDISSKDDGVKFTLETNIVQYNSAGIAGGGVFFKLPSDVGAGNWTSDCLTGQVSDNSVPQNTVSGYGFGSDYASSPVTMVATTNSTNLYPSLAGKSLSVRYVVYDMFNQLWKLNGVIMIIARAYYTATQLPVSSSYQFLTTQTSTCDYYYTGYAECTYDFFFAPNVGDITNISLQIVANEVYDTLATGNSSLRDGTHTDLVGKSSQLIDLDSCPDDDQFTACDQLSQGSCSHIDTLNMSRFATCTTSATHQSGSDFWQTGWMFGALHL